MATVTIDYEADGDVQLILVTQTETTPLELADPDSLLPGDPKKLSKYNIGPLHIHVNQFRLCVSSIKLIASSHYFQAMLERQGFPECKELTENGHVEIQLLDTEDNPTAMMIVLSILYANEMQVTNDVDFLTLYNIAVLVDKYEWHQLVTPHAISWFDKLLCSSSLPDAFDNTLFSWLWMAWLFGMEGHFKTLSKLAQQVATSSIDVKDVKIRLPDSVIMAINKQRETAFQKVEKVVEALKERLLDLEDQKEDLLPEQKMLRSFAFGFAVLCGQNIKLGPFDVQDHASTQ